MMTWIHNVCLVAMTHLTLMIRVTCILSVGMPTSEMVRYYADACLFAGS
jgi:hypothetical protein